MSDRPEQSDSSHSTTLSDDQVGDLLTAFFQHEEPQVFEQPEPSQTQPLPVAAAVVIGQRTAARSVTALAGMVAACALLIFAGLKVSSVVENANAPIAGQQQPDLPEDEQLMNVSSDPGSDITVDDTNTTLEEIEQIDLSPEE